MDDAVSTQQRQTSSDAVGRATRRRQRKPAVAAPLQRLVQVDTELLEDDARVTSKLEVIDHANDVAVAVRVSTRQQAEHADLVDRLPSEPLLAANDLERHPTTRLVIKRAHYLTETAAAEHFKHFIAAHTSYTYNQRQRLTALKTNESLSVY